MHHSDHTQTYTTFWGVWSSLFSYPGDMPGTGRRRRSRKMAAIYSSQSVRRPATRLLSWDTPRP